MKHMKKIKWIGKAVLMLSMALMYIACNDDESGSIPFEVLGDVYIIKKEMNGQSKYANIYYAYGNQPMSYAEVTTPGGMDIELIPASQQNNIWGISPDSSDFNVLVEEGNYMFNVINEDIPHQATDLSELFDIDFTTITLLDMDNELLTLEWDANVDAEKYVIRLIDDSGDITFLSQLLEPQVGRFVINPGDPQGAWARTPVPGETFILELQALKFEDNSNENNYIYNIQTISITEELVTWQ